MATPKRVHTSSLRVPKELRERLVRAAKKASRSTNEEMVLRLEQSFKLTERQKIQIELVALMDEGKTVAQRLEQALKRALKS